MMKGVGLCIVILAISILYLDAFLPSPQPHHARRSPHRAGALQSSFLLATNSNDSNDSNDNTDSSSKDATTQPATELTHADILWKIRPPPETPWYRRVWLRFAANTIRLDAMLKREEPPLVLCPKGGQAVLEAHCKNQAGSYEKIARFGFSTERGPPAPPIQETVQELYQLPPTVMVGVAAIIYMFVEPQHRRRNVGTLALQVISLVHAIQNCDFTVLVVDDDGSGKLNEWYERQGYRRAPKLQALMGSPDAVNGITMIKPTDRLLPEDCHIRWW